MSSGSSSVRRSSGYPFPSVPWWRWFCLSITFADITHDKRNSIRTLPIIIGKENGIRLFAALIMMAYLSILVMSLLGLLHLWSLIVLISLPLAFRLRCPACSIPGSGESDLTTKEFNCLLLVGTVIVATVLWFVTFYLSWSTFWIKITFSAATLSCLALWLQPGILKGLRFDMKSILVGLLSAAALYFIFWMGKLISTTIFPLPVIRSGPYMAKAKAHPCG